MSFRFAQDSLAWFFVDVQDDSGRPYRLRIGWRRPDYLELELVEPAHLGGDAVLVRGIHRLRDLLEGSAQ